MDITEDVRRAVLAFSEASADPESLDPVCHRLLPGYDQCSAGSALVRRRKRARPAVELSHSAPAWFSPRSLRRGARWRARDIDALSDFRLHLSRVDLDAGPIAGSLDHLELDRGTAFGQASRRLEWLP
jgi:hypothetical protein